MVYIFGIYLNIWHILIYIDLVHIYIYIYLVYIFGIYLNIWYILVYLDLFGLKPSLISHLPNLIKPEEILSIIKILNIRALKIIICQ